MNKQPWTKDVLLKVRVTKAELDTLRAYAERSEKSMSEVVRKWIASLGRKSK